MLMTETNEKEKINNKTVEPNRKNNRKGQREIKMQYYGVQ